METNTNIEKAGYLAESKVSKSNNNKGKSFTYSTVIPKPIVNKFGLDKGRKLYWDIDDLSITITPELPEDDSIQAGYDILNDMLINGNTTSYIRAFSNIKTHLEAKGEDTNSKITHIVDIYTSSRDETEKANFKQVVLYLLDYPTTPENHEIIKEVYNEITKTD